MNISKKHLFFNKYFVFSFFLIILVPFFSWAISSEFFSFLFFWDTGAYTKWEYMNIVFPFANYPEFGFGFLQLIFPVFPAIIILPFLNIKKIMLFSYTRVKSYKSFLLKTILKYLFVGCLLMFLAYLIFLLIGASFLQMSKNNNTPIELFSEIFGKDFYTQHLFYFFVVQGFLRFFIFSFVFGLFSIAISFLTHKKYLCVLIPISYYIISAIVVAVFESAFSVNLLFLSPVYTLMSTSRPYVNSFAIIAPMIPILAFSITIIVRDVTNKSKRNDVFGAT